jgi:hypothetical protein
MTDDAVHLARHRIADRIAADRIGRLIDKFDAMRQLNLLCAAETRVARKK